ncbi:MAG TPA: uridylate kinase [Methanophagales archaeon]|nr:uridylate kinase [Methanophagales archaeon]
MNERSRIQAEEVYVLKIGGSVLTEKDKVRKARKSAITRISKEIALALAHGRGAGTGAGAKAGTTTRKKLILVHGAGSYGHPQAKVYLASRAAKDALITHESAKELNQIVTSSLMEFGVKIMPIHPLSGVVFRGGEPKYKIKEQIELALEAGIVPVLHGDVIMDEKEGFRILSGDQLVVYAAKEFKASRVGVGTDVDGVLDDEGEVIRKITPAEVDKVSIKGSEHVDVTGGMKEKVYLLAKLASETNIPSVLFNASKESNVYKFLTDDEDLFGTVVG